MRQLTQALVLGLLILAAPTGPASAAPEDRKVVLSVNRSWAPYLIFNEDTGERSGLVLDVLAEIAEKIGYQIVVELLPSKRSRMYLEQGKIDAKIKAMEWVDDAENYYWTRPIFNITDVLVYRRAAPLDYQRPEDLHEKIIGTRDGWGYPGLEPLFQSGSAVREDSGSDEAMLSMLLLGRTDAATMNVHVLKWLQTSNSRFREDLAFAERSVGDVGLRLYLSKLYDWQPFVDAFDQELAAMKEDRRLQVIVDRYLAM